MKKRRVIDYKRKWNVPDGWEIHNAARPLSGNMTWKGEFISGRYYAAVNPDSKDYDWHAETNVSLDARLIVPVTEDDAVAEISAYYAERFPTRWSSLRDSITHADLIEAWYNAGFNVEE
jgi:hypothetical protein